MLSGGGSRRQLKSGKNIAIQFHNLRRIKMSEKILSSTKRYSKK